jgi:zinc protease
MGQGSAHASPREYTAIVEGSGGITNAATAEDRTSYWATVPSNMVETMLWLEADRLASQLSSVTKAEVDVELAAVASERRTRYEAVTFGIANELTVATLFPSGHPYSGSPAGVMDQLRTVPVSELQAFARKYYVPSNAVLVVTGDVDARQTRGWIEKYFAGIPGGVPPTKTRVPAVKLDTEKRVALEATGATTTRLRLIWIAPDLHSPDKPAMQMLAKVLTAAKVSLLQRVLVTDRRLATAVTAINADLEASGLFQIEVAAARDSSLTTIEQVVDSLLAVVRTRPVDPQLIRRAVADSAVASVVGLQLTSARSNLLAEGQLFQGDPTALLRSRERFDAVTAADVQRVAATYLTPGRVVMSMVPPGKLDLVSKPALPYTNITPR